MEKKFGEKRNKSRFKPNYSTNKDLKEMTLVTSKNHRNDTLKNLIKKIDFKEVVIMEDRLQNCIYSQGKTVMFIYV